MRHGCDVQLFQLSGLPCAGIWGLVLDLEGELMRFGLEVEAAMTLGLEIVGAWEAAWAVVGEGCCSSEAKRVILFVQVPRAASNEC